MRRAVDGEADADTPVDTEVPENGEAGPVTLSQERYVELSAREEMVLTVSERGFGKRTSSYEYRVTGRGGKGRELLQRGQFVRIVPGEVEVVSLGE